LDLGNLAGGVARADVREEVGGGGGGEVLEGDGSEAPGGGVGEGDGERGLGEEAVLEC